MQFTGSKGATVNPIILCRDGLQATLEYLKNHEDILDSKNSLLTKDQRTQLWGIWNKFLDYQLTLDAMHDRFNLKTLNQNNEEAFQLFLNSYACFLISYRYSLEFIKYFELNPSIHVILNQSTPDIGLPSKSYAHLKYQFLHVNKARDFIKYSLIHKAIVPASFPSPLTDIIKQNVDYIWNTKAHSGIQNTLKNGLKIVTEKIQELWHPIQKKSLFLGTLKVRRIGHRLISNQQIQALIPSLLPGDIVLARREWHLSNLGIPGFWPHAALYIGTPQTRSAYFCDTFEASLYQQPNYSDCLKKDENNYAPRVIESHAPGVTFTSLEYSCAADSVAILRPNLPKEVKERAILRAFGYVGRPYDYDFDFRSDKALVCTELVYKSYETSDGLQGLNLPFDHVLGKPVLPANQFAKVFDKELEKKSPQFELVKFLDGDERLNVAQCKGVEDFRNSWKRPKWHIVVKGTVFE